MGWKTKVLEQGGKLLQSERILRVLEDERVMKGVMRAIELRGKVQERFDESVERVAKSLNLATRSEVSDLKRTIRKLERDLERQRPQSHASSRG